MPDPTPHPFETCLEQSRPYYFGDGIAGQFPAVLRKYAFDRCFLVTSASLLRTFGRDLLAVLEAAGVRCDAVLVPDGERQKGWETLRGLCEELVDRGVTKDSVILAMGGGVLGNIAGLAAAMIYRGVRFVQIPTTVTGQTDSTLSNKQAVNGAKGKNQFGVYYAPLFIWGDAAYPRSEPRRQQVSGVVEGVKNVLISHYDVRAADPLLGHVEAGRLPEMLRWLIDSKLPILRRDPTEKGYAIVLEYGHTFGHAIEWLAGGKLLHGEAVSIGMCLAAEVSHALGHMAEPLLRDHYRLLSRLGTPTRLPADLRPTDVYDAMLADNKRTGKGLRFLLLSRCGQFVNPDGDYMVAVDRDVILRELERSREGAASPAVTPASV